MIGLRRGTVKLVGHQVSWKRLFATEARRLRTIPDVIQVEHIGSTSVPGIQAKPIVDILLGVRSIKNFRKQLHRISILGYEQKKKVTFPNRRYFFTKGPESRRIIHLHIQRYGGAKWKQDIFFKKWLVRHPRDRKAYERLKIRLAQQHGDDRKKYTQGKNEFIQSILGKNR